MGTEACQWCGDDAHRCEMINGSCGWIAAARAHWEAQRRLYPPAIIVAPWESLQEGRRKMLVRAMRESVRECLGTLLDLTGAQ